MRRLGLKYISSSGVNFPAVNSGKWNLATNFKGNFNRILTESGIDGDDYETVALYQRYIETGMFLCAARRFYPVNEQPGHFQTLWMFVPSSIIISKEDLSKAAMELTGIFDHPEAFTSMEAFEDILPPIFLQDFEEVDTGEKKVSEEEKKAEEAGKKLELEIFEAFSEMGKEKKEEKSAEPKRKMTGERIGYVGYENIAEFELLLSSGYIPQYSNFGLIFLTDYPVRVESLLPGIFHPDLLLHRQLERERIREEEEKKHCEEEEARQEAEKEECENSENNEETAELPEPVEEDAAEGVVEEEKNENDMEENDAALEIEETLENVEKVSESVAAFPEAEEFETWKAERKKEIQKNISMRYFWLGVVSASILFLLGYIVVQVYRTL